MLCRVKPVWENTEQELVVCNAINLIYEHRALILPTDWQQCEELPTFLCECERQPTCFDCSVLFFPPIFLRIDMMGDQRKLESRVTFHSSQGAKKKRIFLKTHFYNNFPSSLWLGHMGMFSYWRQSWWKERLCFCVNHGNDPHTLHLCALLVLLPHSIVYNLTANSSHTPFFFFIGFSTFRICADDVDIFWLRTSTH